MIDVELLKQRHHEELEDAENYEKLSKECPEYGSVFRDISREEKTHAKLLEFVMEHMTN